MDNETLRGIETEERAYQDTKDVIAALTAARTSPPRSLPAQELCERCGRPTSRVQLMVSSTRGNVCPDCYDEDDY